jgi:Sec-independent protein secretion pathway component TatC
MPSHPPAVSMTFVHAGLVSSSLLEAEQRYYLYLKITIGSILRPQDHTVLVPLQEPSVARPPVGGVYVLFL